MRLPRGELVRSRVVSDPATALVAAAERELTGYAVFEPQDSLLLDADGRGVVTFEAGVPVLAYHTGTDRGGPEAIADLAVPGPYSVDLHRLPRMNSPLFTKRMSDEFRRGCPPSDWRATRNWPRRRARMHQRIRSLDGDREDTQTSALEAFLDDDEKIGAIQEQAREEAERRAEEWGLDDQLGG